MNDLISVIVPVYNVEKYVEKCLKSIMNQTYKNLEIIVINDGTLDNSLAICEKLAQKDSRIKVLSKKNGGLASARNYGLKHANGKYVGFVDSDDYIEPDMYQYLHELLISNNSQVAICNHNIVKNGKITTSFLDDKVVTYDSTTAFKLLLEDDKIHNFACDKLFLRQLFNNISFKKLTYHEDIATIFKTFYKAKFITVSNKPCYNYIMNSDSISHNLTPLKTYHSFLAYLEIHNFVLENYRVFEDLSVIRMAYAGIASINTFLRNNVERNNKNNIENIKFNIKKNIILILKNKDINVQCKMYCIMLNLCFPIYKFICNLNINAKLKKDSI